ncbi:unnamed protein product [Musa textilis]
MQTLIYLCLHRRLCWVTWIFPVGPDNESVRRRPPWSRGLRRPPQGRFPGLVPPGSAASTPATPFRPTSSPPTSRCRPISSTPPSAPAVAPSASSSSSSSCLYPKYSPQPIPESALLSGLSNPPTSGTRWPTSPASRCARRTGSSTASTPSAPCRPTSTAPTTTSTRRTPTCSRSFSVVSTKPRPRGQSRWWCGARGHR